jgi:hypothetical protein
MNALMASSAVLPATSVQTEAMPRRRDLRLVAVAAQVGLAVLVLRAFRIESRTFFDVVLVAALGFVPHALLPRAWRLPAFALLSAVALVVAIGPLDALRLLGVGTVLVGICHLPVRVAARVALLVAAGGALAAARSGVLPAPWDAGVWAVFGSIFMFRLALYLHAVRHEPVRPTAAQAAGYFLMLPNPVFPLFPVVDFATFVRTHYAGDETTTYQTGVAWIARGLVHLLLYRVVYQHLPPDPLRLASLGELTWYLLGTFLLYLRVSGQFHLIIGILHLYGFALPETHRLFFLSSSFTDFWRRINIYWKDFMMKLVYYPSFFRLRRRGGTVALVGATTAVFLVTWLLHAYQWFWILGRFPITVPDTLFWAILGALVVVTALREAKRGRDRALGARRWSASLAVRTVATFCALCVLWSLWSAESVVEWAWMWRAGARVDAAGVLLLAALLAGGLAVAGRNWSAPRLSAAARPRPWQRLDVRTATTLTALLVLGQPAVAERLAAAAPALAALRRTTLNAADAAVQRRGYYERLDHAPRLGAQGWEASAKTPADWTGFDVTAAFHERDDFRLFELRPDARVTFLRQTVTTNAWGMRDAPRALAKPPGTVRLAIMGPSYVFGSGVADGDPFPAQLERRLNAQRPAGGTVRYEALNFGAPAHSLLQQLATLREDAVRFAPDVALLFIYNGLTDATALHLAQVVSGDVAVPYPGLDSLLRRRWRASSRLPWSELMGVLRIASDDVHAWAVREFAAECRRRGIVPVLVALDLVGAPPNPNAALMRVASDAGVVVLDLMGAYGPEERHAALAVAEWDTHPNRAGHALVADRLLAELRRRPALLRPAAGAPHDPSRQPRATP